MFNLLHFCLSFSKGICQTFEHELSWSVDNGIEVPPGYQTKAELVIREDNFNGDFQILTTFEGKVSCQNTGHYIFF